MTRPARAIVNAQALRHNLNEVRRRAPRSRVMAIVKANGYGHGLVWVAETLADHADAFGVAAAEEGIVLREAGIRRPICLLEGFFSADELPVLVEHDLQPAVHHEAQVRALEAARLARPLAVWIKIDTGMHRLGFPPAAFGEVLARLKAAPSVGEIRVLSHFAAADDPKMKAATQAQIDLFNSTVAGAAIERCFANSAGIIAWPAVHFEWVRPGIMLYGGAPMAEGTAQSHGLRPVMTLAAELIAVSPRKKGDPIGYGPDFRCPDDMPVGVAAIGYGDGYPRRMPAGTPVLVNGKRVPLIGRVSMDMITLDLRSQPDAKPGDPVVLWGEGLPVDEIAARAGTISYELYCHVAKRIPRVPAE
ncbi:MAG: alanine racemase [Sulfurifustis sp.]